MATSSSSKPPDRLPERIAGVMRDSPLVSFFVLAFGVTWLLWTPVVILGLPVFSATTHAPSWYLMPGVAIEATGSAFLMTAMTQGGLGCGGCCSA